MDLKFCLMASFGLWLSLQITVIRSTSCIEVRKGGNCEHWNSLTSTVTIFAANLNLSQ